jgi:SAM-dependent methyltransferase
MPWIKQLAKRSLLALNIDLYRRTEDRRILETIILPWLMGLPGNRRVLFVGCDWYTRGYRKWFDQDSYWTMDYDVAKAPYGSRLHITDSMTNVTRHFGIEALDLVLCNGVFGWGLNERAQVEHAFSAVSTVLRSGGLLLIGWNDTPKRKPFPLESIQALQRLRRRIIDPLGQTDVRTDTPNQHVYSLFEKPAERSWHDEVVATS